MSVAQDLESVVSCGDSPANWVPLTSGAGGPWAREQFKPPWVPTRVCTDSASTAAASRKPLTLRAPVSCAKGTRPLQGQVRKPKEARPGLAGRPRGPTRDLTATGCFCGFVTSAPQLHVTGDSFLHSMKTDISRIVGPGTGPRPVLWAQPPPRTGTGPVPGSLHSSWLNCSNFCSFSDSSISRMFSSWHFLSFFLSKCSASPSVQAPSSVGQGLATLPPHCSGFGRRLP